MPPRLPQDRPFLQSILPTHDEALAASHVSGERRHLGASSFGMEVAHWATEEGPHATLTAFGWRWHNRPTLGYASTLDIPEVSPVNPDLANHTTFELHFAVGVIRVSRSLMPTHPSKQQRLGAARHAILEGFKAPSLQVASPEDKRLLRSVLQRGRRVSMHIILTRTRRL
jgi:hypothetical protein